MSRWAQLITNDSAKNESFDRDGPLNELGQLVEAAGAISRLGNTRDKAAKQARGTIGIDEVP